MDYVKQGASPITGHNLPFNKAWPQTVFERALEPHAQGPERQKTLSVSVTACLRDFAVKTSGECQTPQHKAREEHNAASPLRTHSSVIEIGSARNDFDRYRCKRDLVGS
jgi:hypothetical protein